MYIKSLRYNYYPCPYFNVGWRQIAIEVLAKLSSYIPQKTRKYYYIALPKSLQWRHNEHDSVSNHQPHDCLLNRLFGRRSKKTSKLRGTGLCAGNSPVTGEFPAQMASNAETVCTWWRHHAYSLSVCRITWVGVILTYVTDITYLNIGKNNKDKGKWWNIWLHSE